jgi:hypothetical protein
VIVTALLTLVALGAAFVALHGAPWTASGSRGGGLTVEHAALRPGQIVLTLQSHSAEVISIAQVIVNDAFVNFVAGAPATADLAIDYPWIEGESYDISLMTSTGSTVDYQIEDASSS